MARFNTATEKTLTKTTTRVNRAGGESYVQSSKLALVSFLLTNFVKNQFYRSSSESLDELDSMIANLRDKQFAAKAAIFARNEYGMRSVTHVAAAEIAHQVKGEEWTKKFFDKVVRRPDDMTEILAYYFSKYGTDSLNQRGNVVKRSVPNSLKKGFREALRRFDEYQIAKYQGKNRDVSLIDVVNLVRPVPTPAITALVNGTIKPANTWETNLTQAGQSAESEEHKEELKREAWTNLLKENKLGYLALLRNLRNIMTQAPDALPLALKALVNEQQIKKSLVMPFQILTAHDQFTQYSDSNARKILAALSQALEISLNNVPTYDGETLVVLDRSGSMTGQPTRIGSVFAAALAKTNNADFMIFGDTAKFYPLKTHLPTLDISADIANTNGGGHYYGADVHTRSYVGHGTNFKDIFNKIDKQYDRIIILSDMQGWIGYNTPKPEFNAYKKEFGVNPHLYMFDLAGYGDMMFPEDQVYCLAGFSDKVFDTMAMLETDRNALVSQIENQDL